jgi:hypothetical protein
MYFGSMLCVSGILLGAGNLGLLAAFHVVFHIFTMPRKQRQEGKRLLRRFGMDYAEYVVSVSSLVPRLTPYESKEPTEFSLGRAVDIARAVNPTLDFLMTSAVAPGGMDEWLGYCRARARRGVLV